MAGEANGAAPSLPATGDPVGAAIVRDMEAYRGRGSENVAAPGVDVVRELAAIAKTRKENRRAYNRDEALQARERKLLAHQEEQEAQKRQLFDPGTVERWRRDGTGAMLAEVAHGIDDPALIAGFDGLPKGAQQKLVGALRDRRPTFATFYDWLDRAEGTMTAEELRAVESWARALLPSDWANLMRAVCRAR